ncbi:MAG: thioredoxin [Deltaproteobacteria bacterium SG8_13]|nr:MAG: thioredoxin [Deltaproteobacteria bacterium SG8_13]
MSNNLLAGEKSPYLLQHARNPVQWHPWSTAAFEKAQRENKPIFLSIGYATCHWCHVMEKETFEDEEAARFLNTTFVCIKVDREERPDIDSVYMSACQMLTGGGGWPLTIFMTPDKKPFFAATYLPKRNRFGRAGVIDLCQQVQALWQNQKEKLLTSAEGIAAHLDKAFAFKPAEEPGEELLKRAFEQIAESYDEQFGGFDPAPKFPTPHRLLFLLRCYHRSGDARALEMVEKTLVAMRMGGIWDHVGFGMHRYATDRHWLLPHFEKMLYDQALAALAYLEAYQVTSNPFYADTAREIFTYVLRDMHDVQGGFYSAEDADSEGEEGKFYVWTDEEFTSALGPEAAAAWASVFHLKKDGNFHDEATGQKTGANILHVKQRSEEIARKAVCSTEDFDRQWEKIRTALYRERIKRIPPLKDDKVLTDWNGLMIAALARGWRVLGEPAFREAAQSAADFIFRFLRTTDGSLLHRYRDGEAAIAGHAEDYAFFIFGLLELYRATAITAYLEEAIALQDRMLTDFWDSTAGGFYSTTADTELPVRPKELYDGAIPSANSAALVNLLLLARMTGDTRWAEKAHELVRAFAGTLRAHPAGFTFFLLGLDLALHPGQDVVVTGETDAKETLEMLAALNSKFDPNGITQVKTSSNAEQLSRVAGYTDGLDVVRGKATAYICKDGACQDSTTDVNQMLKQMLARRR